MHRAHCDSRGGSSFSPRGGGFDPSSTSRVAASRFFLGGGYFTSREAASRFFFFCDFTSREAASWFFWRFYEPRSGEPIFFGYFTSREAASRFFWGYFTSREASLAAQGGGGVKPYCLRLSLRQSAIGTYCVGLDILWWRFSMHINFFFFGSPRGGGV